ncbi:MAG: ABC transporter ATP-binding protein [Chloroflexota bacterium]|nr:ABC transporter ATP-binding protein [Chloroflexota bacterium]
MKPLITIKELKKVYRTGDIVFEALCGVDLEISAGDFVAVMGSSGSGKSTLLHLVGGLDRPTTGTITVAGHSLQEMDETALAKFRRAHVGFIFQFFNLIGNLTIQANVELPALLTRRPNKPAIRRRSNALLAELKIADQGAKHPWELSGGQQQRVAIARALINQPTLLLADEPTGNLDSRSGQDVLDILSASHRQGQTILMVTHDAWAAARAARVLFLQDGNVIDTLSGGAAQQIAARATALENHRRQS